MTTGDDVFTVAGLLSGDGGMVGVTGNSDGCVVQYGGTATTVTTGGDVAITATEGCFVGGCVADCVTVFTGATVRWTGAVGDKEDCMVGDDVFCGMPAIGDADRCVVVAAGDVLGSPGV